MGPLGLSSRAPQGLAVARSSAVTHDLAIVIAPACLDVRIEKDEITTYSPTALARPVGEAVEGTDPAPQAGDFGQPGFKVRQTPPAPHRALRSPRRMGRAPGVRGPFATRQMPGTRLRCPVGGRL